MRHIKNYLTILDCADTILSGYGNCPDKDDIGYLTALYIYECAFCELIRSGFPYESRGNILVIATDGKEYGCISERRQDGDGFVRKGERPSETGLPSAPYLAEAPKENGLYSSIRKREYGSAYNEEDAEEKEDGSEEEESIGEDELDTDDIEDEDPTGGSADGGQEAEALNMDGFSVSPENEDGDGTDGVHEDGRPEEEYGLDETELLPPEESGDMQDEEAPDEADLLLPEEDGMYEGEPDKEPAGYEDVSVGPPEEPAPGTHDEFMGEPEDNIDVSVDPDPPDDLPSEPDFPDEDGFEEDDPPEEYFGPADKEKDDAGEAPGDPVQDLEAIETEQDEEEMRVTSMPLTMARGDFTMAKHTVRIWDERLKKKDSEGNPVPKVTTMMLTMPLSIDTDRPRIMVCIMKGANGAGLYVSKKGKNTVLADMRGIPVLVSGRMENGEYVSTCELADGYTEMGYRIDSDCKTYGRRGHVVMDDDDSQFHVHIMPIGFANAKGKPYGQFCYLAETKNGDHLGDSIKSSGHAFLESDGRRYDLVIRWSADGMMACHITDKGPSD